MSLALLVVSWARTSFFIGGRHRNVVEVAAQLVKHVGFIGARGGRRSWLGQRWHDVVDGCSRVCSTKEVALCVGGVLLAFDGELGSAEGCFPGGPVFGGGGEPVPVWALFGEAAG